jgi:ABC-type lipoprotein release transport system permease subunit
MDIHDKEFEAAVASERNRLEIASMFTEFIGVVLFLIGYWVMQGFFPQLDTNIFLTIVLFILVGAVAWGIKVGLDKMFMKIAYIRAYEKYQPTDKLSDWYESFHVFFEATHGREPTCKELDDALDAWLENENNPQH